ncbi:MAG: exodeoxyribonuclease VII large subunit [Planctomycetaceae bacterium]|nr:exodeoxyribonuclease VII large subunit [Planctomycetaceae bacterium]MCP4776769.1 exodeoxyribonuclease VII large subunit [Planctomycetaceae bacterium]
MSSSKSSKNVQTVSELTQSIKRRLNDEFQSVLVSGEISGMTKAGSGHIYLTLKDEKSSINGIIWRSDAAKLKFDLTNGLAVECRGGIDVYAQRGTYQIIIRGIRPQGIGALELAFRQLHEKLAGEGLFDPSVKKELPSIPKHICVVTSPTSAAVRDFLQVLTRRWPRIRVTVVPVKVQGPGAADEIAEAIEICNQMGEPVDVIAVTRGGGSVEDLWSFNEEVVVRAIYQSEIPVISGVGHEIDVTLTDLVADVRALTPSEAAERLVPQFSEVTGGLDVASDRMTKLILGRLDRARRELAVWGSRPVLTQPLERLRESAMELDFLENSMSRSVKGHLVDADRELASMAARLDAISPLAVLSRGYSLTMDSEGTPIRDPSALKPGDRLFTRLSAGTVESTVELIKTRAEDSKSQDC